MTQEEEDYLVVQYTKSGFKNSLQFYQHTVIPFLVMPWYMIADNGFVFVEPVPLLAGTPRKWCIRRQCPLAGDLP